MGAGKRKKDKTILKKKLDKKKDAQSRHASFFPTVFWSLGLFFFHWHAGRGRALLCHFVFVARQSQRKTKGMTDIGGTTRLFCTQSQAKEKSPEIFCLPK
nr:hypothetical protein [Pandoravirus aubagnensis]